MSAYFAILVESEGGTSSVWDVAFAESFELIRLNGMNSDVSHDAKDKERKDHPGYKVLVISHPWLRPHGLTRG